MAAEAKAAAHGEAEPAAHAEAEPAAHAEAEPAADGQRDLAAHRERLMDGLRVYGGHYTELSRRFAAWLGLHSTDATALLEIVFAEERGAPISPARLSERIPLSSGATTALLNRLEAGGHIERSREHTDRRIVTLRCGPHIQEWAQKFFTPLAEPLDAMLAHYPPELREDVERFLGDLNGVMAAYLARPDAAPRPPARRAEEKGKDR